MESVAVATSEITGVLIADSSQMHSQLLAGALRRRPEFSVLTCTLELDAILAAVESAGVQLILLHAGDTRFESRGMAIVRRLNMAYPQVAQVLLLEKYDRDLVISAFRSGVRGLFDLSGNPFRLLCKCIQQVRHGQIWANSEQMQYLVDVITRVPSLRVVNARGHNLLTPREEQVVALVADGLSNREVASELHLSEHTIKKYMFRIFEKLGISSRVELVLYAVNHGDHRDAEWVAGA